MDLKPELERADRELENQLTRSNFIARWIARQLIQSKHRDNIKKGITHGTDFLSDILQKL